MNEIVTINQCWAISQVAHPDIYNGCGRINDSLSMLLISSSFLIRLSQASFKKSCHRKLWKSVYFTCISNAYAEFRIVRSKDLQKIVLSKCQNADTPTEIHCDSNDGIDLRTFKR